MKSSSHDITKSIFIPPNSTLDVNLFCNVNDIRAGLAADSEVGTLSSSSSRTRKYFIGTFLLSVESLFWGTKYVSSERSGSYNNNYSFVWKLWKALVI